VTTFTWDLPHQMTHPPENVRLRERQIERVLLQYDGPQLVVLSDGRQKYLGYVADELDNGIRWLHVPVSNLELKALHRGKLTLREALEKAEINIVDVSHAGETSDVWIAPPLVVPLDCLPEPGLLLPAFARDRSAEDQPDRLAFECEGAGVGNGVITFECLGAFTSALQRLWFVLAKRSGVDIDRTAEFNAATLAFAAGHAGSFAIEVARLDNESFDVIATQYKDLIHASYEDPSGLDARVTRSPELSYAWGQYAEALETHRIDVLANWSTDAVFLGNDRAKRVAKSYGRRTRRDPRAVVGPPQIARINVDGYFDGLMHRRHRFDFVDPSRDEDYSGDIDRAIAEELQTMDITLGRHVFYRASIEISTHDDGKVKHTLVGLKELAEQLKLKRG
jgi:hypothetical protein